MRKGIVLTQRQIEMYQRDAIRFLFPIVGRIIYSSKDTPEDLLYIIKDLKIGDKNIFIKEDFLESYFGTNNKHIKYKNQFTNISVNTYNWVSAEQMLEYQSRYLLQECTGVSILKADKINYNYLDVKTIREFGIQEDDAIRNNNWRPTYNDPDSGGDLEWCGALEDLLERQLVDLNLDGGLEVFQNWLVIEFNRG